MGAGSFGKVFLVRRRRDGGVFAMKMLKKRDLIIKKQLRYAVTESNVLKKCRHPFILALHHSFQVNKGEIIEEGGWGMKKMLIFYYLFRLHKMFIWFWIIVQREI